MSIFSALWSHTQVMPMEGVYDIFHASSWAKLGLIDYRASFLRKYCLTEIAQQKKLSQILLDIIDVQLEHITLLYLSRLSNKKSQRRGYPLLWFMTYDLWISNFKYAPLYFTITISHFKFATVARWKYKWTTPAR